MATVLSGTIGDRRRGLGCVSRRGALAAGTALLLALSGQAAGQDLVPKAGPQDRPVVLTGAMVHPVTGPSFEDGAVVIDGGVITFSGPASEAPSIGGARVIDLSGKHLYPGLIAADTQTGLTEVSSFLSTEDTRETGRFTPEVVVVNAVNPDSTHIPVTRSNGVLITGILPEGGRVAGTGGVLRLDGWTNDDLTVESHAGLVMTWPFTRAVVAWWNNTPEREQLARIREQLQEIDDLFSEVEAYALNREQDGSAPIDLRLESMRRVFPAGTTTNPSERQMPLWIRAADLDQITSAVNWAVSRDLKPIIWGGRDAPLAADLLKAHGVPVVVGTVHGFPKRDDSPYDDAFTVPARLAAAGVSFCITGTERDGNQRNTPFEAALAAAYGLDPEHALRSITIDAARVLGIADRYGSIEVGKSGTVIVTDGNPLEIMTSVEMAFIEGREVDLSDKQKSLRDKYEEKYRQLGDLED